MFLGNRPASLSGRKPPLIPPYQGGVGVVPPYQGVSVGVLGYLLAGVCRQEWLKHWGLADLGANMLGTGIRWPYSKTCWVSTMTRWKSIKIRWVSTTNNKLCIEFCWIEHLERVRLNVLTLHKQWVLQKYRASFAQCWLVHCLECLFT